MYTHKDTHDSCLKKGDICTKRKGGGDKGTHHYIFFGIEMRKE